MLVVIVVTVVTNNFCTKNFFVVGINTFFSFPFQTHKKKFVTKKRSKTQVVMKLKNSNGKKKTIKQKMVTKLKNPNSDKTQKVKL